MRAVPGVGDEYEIVLVDRRRRARRHDDPRRARRRRGVGRAGGAEEIRSRCEVRVDVEVLAPGTLPKTEFKAKRVRDLRRA